MSKEEQTSMEERFYLRPNDKEECWELLERDAINDDGVKEDALIARFYDGNASGSALAEFNKGFLNGDGEETDEH